jgi:hypothetical protein
MSSNQELLPDPQVRIASPPSIPPRSVKSAAISSPQSALSTMTTPGRTASPNPHMYLRSPPVEMQLSHRSREGYFMANQSGSPARRTRNTSPSEGRSILGSSTGSFHSSDTGLSPCSGSSEYLTPPCSQPDSDHPPYKARRRSSESLSMRRKPKRSKTDPLRKKGRKHRRCRYKNGREHEHSHGHWCMHSCQLAPTAPKGQRDLCDGHVGVFKPRKFDRGNTDTYGRMMPRSRSDPAPPMVTRRWSSVEIGTHQIRLPSTLPESASGPSSPENPATRKFSRYRSSSYTRGSIDNNIQVIQTVRERLTSRKIPTTLKTPKTITLRRASGESEVSGVTTITDIRSPLEAEQTGTPTPRAYPKDQVDNRRNTAYLITRQDIDSITELIEANLRRTSRPHDRLSAITPAVISVATPTQKTSRAPNFTSKGLLPQSSPAGVAITVTEVQMTCGTQKDCRNLLQILPTTDGKMRPTIPTSPQPSTHEVIWEPRGSTPTGSSDIEDERKTSNHSPSRSHETSPELEEKGRKPDTPDANKSDAFDPRNARASINQWSWRMSLSDLPMTVSPPSEDLTPFSEMPPKIIPEEPSISLPGYDAPSPDIPDHPPSKHKAKRPGLIRAAQSHPELAGGLTGELLNVFSFPPLPRKKTCDWYSPLPDINDITRPSSPARCLYDAGIDASGPNIMYDPVAAKPYAPNTSRSSTSTTSNLSSLSPKIEIRRKSVIKHQACALPRVGTASSTGASLGISTGRRRSSHHPIQGIKRVRTTDAAEKPKRSGTWVLNRPPSICPPPKSPSISELSAVTASPVVMSPSLERMSPDDEREELYMPVPQRAVERMKMIKNASPPSAKADHRTGTYERLTGARRSSEAKFRLEQEVCANECCKPQAQLHVCDDCMNDPRRVSVDWIG